LVLTLAIAFAATGVLGCGGDEDPDDGGSRKPAPAYYLTGKSASDLRRQAYHAAARFARGQGPGHALLMLDFGAARLRGSTWGVSLRSGTFFSNDEVHSALQAAADGYNDNYRRGEVTIVYVASNARLTEPGQGFKRFSERLAREAGEQQASAIRGLDLHANESVAVGGDIEPGYDPVGSPEISIALVAGAVEASGGAYYNIGTAPCRAGRCINGWTPRHICEVSDGGGRQVLPEVYFASSAPGWAEVQKECDISDFAGVSASRIGDLSPKQSRRHLLEKTGAEVAEETVVWPG
jgi:hypothetical protein